MLVPLHPDIEMNRNTASEAAVIDLIFRRIFCSFPFHYAYSDVGLSSDSLSFFFVIGSRSIARIICLPFVPANGDIYATPKLSIVHR